MGSQALSAISLQPLFSLLPSRELEDSAGKRRWGLIGGVTLVPGSWLLLPGTEFELPTANKGNAET